eukprot:2593502-Pleurochrysis_carterae.AAC.2
MSAEHAKSVPEYAHRRLVSTNVLTEWGLASDVTVEMVACVPALCSSESVPVARYLAIERAPTAAPAARAGTSSRPVQLPTTTQAL